jgi:hypothetical protein
MVRFLVLPTQEILHAIWANSLYFLYKKSCMPYGLIPCHFLHKESIHMACLTNVIRQPSLNISPIWIPLISNEVTNWQRRSVWCVRLFMGFYTVLVTSVLNRSPFYLCPYESIILFLQNLGGLDSTSLALLLLFPSSPSSTWGTQAIHGGRWSDKWHTLSFAIIQYTI